MLSWCIKMTAQLVFQVLCRSPKKNSCKCPLKKKIASCMWISAPKEKSSPCAKEIKFPCLSSLLLLHQFSAVEDPRQMHIYLTENSITPLTTWSHNFPLFCHNFQLTYQCSFTKFPTHFIVNFQPWKKSFHSQPQFPCVHHKIQFSRIHLLHETTIKGILHMQPYIPWFIHGDL